MPLWAEPGEGQGVSPWRSGWRQRQRGARLTGAAPPADRAPHLQNGARAIALRGNLLYTGLIYPAKLYVSQIFLLNHSWAALLKIYRRQYD